MQLKRPVVRYVSVCPMSTKAERRATAARPETGRETTAILTHTAASAGSRSKLLPLLELEWHIKLVRAHHIYLASIKSLHVDNGKYGIKKQAIHFRRWTSFKAKQKISSARPSLPSYCPLSFWASQFPLWWWQHTWPKTLLFTPVCSTSTSFAFSYQAHIPHQGMRKWPNIWPYFNYISHLFTSSMSLYILVIFHQVSNQ